MKMQKSILLEKCLKTNMLTIKNIVKLKIISIIFNYTAEYRGGTHIICNLKYIKIYNTSNCYHFIKELPEE